MALLAHLGCSAAAPYLADWAGGDEIHFQRGAPVLGPAAEPPELVRHFVRRLADDRPLGERARHVARALVTGEKRFALLGANLCEGAPLLARRLHLPEAVARALGQLLERWDGNGAPGAFAGEQISRSVRIARVASTWARCPRGSERRVDEIDADVHDHIAHERAQGASDQRIAFSIWSGMVRGLAADAAWRRQHATAISDHPQPRRQR